MRIFLVGGGTGGPTAPLLAVAEVLHKQNQKTEFFFVGTKKGFEARFFDGLGFKVKHLTIPAGKWRRYFSLMNIIDIFRTLFGFIKALFLIKKYHPDLIFGAGSFVQVPVVFAGFLSGVPSVIHQQDIHLLLSTKLASPFAKAITASFSYSAKGIPEWNGLFGRIPKSKITITGNPVRRDILGGTAISARAVFQLNQDYPTLLIMGGSSGAKALNRIVIASLPGLLKYVQVVHLTGGAEPQKELVGSSNYHAYDFLTTDLKHAYAVADLVLCRGGMSTISELARLGKASIIVPLPDSPQEENVRFLSFFRMALGILEKNLTPEVLVKLVRKILWSPELKRTMEQNIRLLLPKDADRRIANLLLKIYNNSRQAYEKRTS